MGRHGKETWLCSSPSLYSIFNWSGFCWIFESLHVLHFIHTPSVREFATMEKLATENSSDHAEQFHDAPEHEQWDAIKIGTPGFGQNAGNSINNNAARDNAKKTNGKQSFASLFKDNRFADESSMLKFFGQPEGDIEIVPMKLTQWKKPSGTVLYAVLWVTALAIMLFLTS